ncbi:MAG: hypothetical protein D6776_02990 [Planctomycetota bacterium]|nr:MAG: hypothetical protein D6776_02990 [Planctomycetota bacterium]
MRIAKRTIVASYPHSLIACTLLALSLACGGCNNGNGATSPSTAGPPADPHPALGAYLGVRESFDYVERDFDIARVTLYEYADGFHMVLEVVDKPVYVNTEQIYISQLGRDWSLGKEGALVRMTRGWEKDKQDLGRGTYQAVIEFAALSASPIPFDPSRPFRLIWGPYEVWF